METEMEMEMKMEIEMEMEMEWKWKWKITHHSRSAVVAHSNSALEVAVS